MTQEEKELFDEKLKGITTLINARFTLVDEKLEDIHKEQLRTNGTVKHHTEQIDEALIERARNREEQKHHVEVLCECKEKLNRIETKLEDLNFVLKHPKLFIAGLVVIVLLTLGTFIESGSNFFKNVTIEPVKTEQIK